MTGSDNDLAQALVDIEDLKTATQVLRSDINDEHANNVALLKTARADFERRIDVLRDQVFARLHELKAHLDNSRAANQDHALNLCAQLRHQVVADLDMLRKRIDDHSASNKGYTAELCARVAKQLDEKFRDVLAKRDATRRN
jgi:hypothetical protein